MHRETHHVPVGEELLIPEQAPVYRISIVALEPLLRLLKYHRKALVARCCIARPGNLQAAREGRRGCLADVDLWVAQCRPQVVEDGVDAVRDAERRGACKLAEDQSCRVPARLVAVVCRARAFYLISLCIARL